MTFIKKKSTVGNDVYKRRRSSLPVNDLASLRRPTKVHPIMDKIDEQVSDNS